MLNLILKNASHLEDYIDQLKEKYPDKIYVTIRNIKGIDASRKEYFARIANFGEKMGYNRIEMHDFVKQNILPDIVKNEQFCKSPQGVGELSTTVLNEAGYTKLLLSIEEYMRDKVDKLI
jgi:hypothetical protein